jgi:hypothetical protein
VFSHKNIKADFKSVLYIWFIWLNFPMDDRHLGYRKKFTFLKKKD